jgi:hypothetical protein
MATWAAKSCGDGVLDYSARCERRTLAADTHGGKRSCLSGIRGDDGGRIHIWYMFRKFGTKLRRQRLSCPPSSPLLPMSSGLLASTTLSYTNTTLSGHFQDTFRTFRGHGNHRLHHHRLEIFTRNTRRARVKLERRATQPRRHRCSLSRGAKGRTSIIWWQPMPSP